MNAGNEPGIPPRRGNVTSLLATIAAMAIMAGYEPEELEPIVFLRGSALLMIAMHAIFHIGTMNALKFMILMKLPQAEDALEAYRDPYRVSHLDLAAAWLGFYALAPAVAHI